MEALRSKVDERVVRLSDAISRDLTTPDIKRAQMQKSVKLLRLGYDERVSFITLYIFSTLDAECEILIRIMLYSRRVECFLVRGVRL